MHRFAIAAFLAATFPVSVLAHDHWINRFVSPIDRTNCCGENDCTMVDPDDVWEVTGGYAVRGLVTYGFGRGARNEWLDEVVPFPEIQASRDGNYWRCKKPDGSRRCFFAPPPST